MSFFQRQSRRLVGYRASEFHLPFEPKTLRHILLQFISPALYQKYPTAVDEWTLSVAMASDTSSGGGLSQLEDHYNTFIVSFVPVPLNLRVSILIEACADGTRFCPDRRCWPQSCSHPSRILGYRSLGWRTLLGEDILDVRLSLSTSLFQFS